MNFQFPCANCKTPLHAVPEHVGARTLCRQCNQWSVVPTMTPDYAGMFLAYAKTHKMWVGFAIIFLILCVVGWNLTKTIEAQDEAHVKRVMENLKGGNVKSESPSANGNELLTAFKAILKKVDAFPDRFAQEQVHEDFNKELRILIKKFQDMPFDAKTQREQGVQIVKLYELKFGRLLSKDSEKRYRGQLFNLLEAIVANIESDLIK